MTNIHQMTVKCEKKRKCYEYFMKLSVLRGNAYPLIWAHMHLYATFMVKENVDYCDCIKQSHYLKLVHFNPQPFPSIFNFY